MRSEPDETATAVELLREACAASSSEMPDELGLEDPHAMRTLGRVLTSNATPTVRPPRYPRPPRPPGGRRIVAVAAPAAAAVAAGIALTVVSLEGSTEALAAKFPVFASTVAPVPAAFRTFKAANVDATSARAIHTPHGTAYATSTLSEKQVCLAAPGITIAGLRHVLLLEPHRHTVHLGYLGGCAPLARVEGRGLLLSIPTRIPSEVELVGILPAGASAPTLHTVTGRTRELRAQHGAIAAIVPAGATLEYEVEGRPVVSRISAHTAAAFKLYAPRER